MRFCGRASVSFLLLQILSIAISTATGARAYASGGAPLDDSPMVKLLRSKRVPADRQGTIVELIGKRGTAQDLAFIYEHAVGADGFPASVRVMALEALSEAAANRNLKPSGELEKLLPLIEGATSKPGASLGTAAIRLAGLWKLEPAVKPLSEIARSTEAEDSIRAEAFDALATIGGKAVDPIAALTGGDLPEKTRLLAITALAKVDLSRASARAAELVATPAAPGRNLVPLLRAFLDRQGGSESLAKAFGGRSIPPDSAKLALRAVYTLGRSDRALVETLSRAAGIAEVSKPLSPAELVNMVAEVMTKGDPARGEDVFRRSDLNCMSCHSVSKAGGDVGPDLSAVGSISPPDYLINSILNPDLAIKEQYNTLVVLTVDGQILQGIVTDKDDQRVVLKDATGATRVVPAANIEDQKAGGSLMPKGLVNLMTRAEFLDLVRFLSELGKPGPYAIRQVPTIQRWNVLKTVTGELTGSVPDAATFREQILHTPPEKWDVVYAKVDGSLPLGELKSKGGAGVFYLQGAIDVSAAGVITVQVDSPAGVRLWVDGGQAPVESAAMSAALSAGRHLVTVRVLAMERVAKTIRVEVSKPAGSTGEFTVVGGR